MPSTVLLADDSVTIQKVVGLSFASEDIEVVAVDNGDEALARARELHPDVVLADVVMPGRNGYQVCEALRSDPATADIPVLLLTGIFETFDEALAERVGASGHVTKPFEAQTLVERVRAAIRSGPPPPPAAAAPQAPTPEPLAAFDPAPPPSPAAQDGDDPEAFLAAPDADAGVGANAGVDAVGDDDADAFFAAPEGEGSGEPDAGLDFLDDDFTQPERPAGSLGGDGSDAGDTGDADPLGFDALDDEDDLGWPAESDLGEATALDELDEAAAVPQPGPAGDPSAPAPAAVPAWDDDPWDDAAGEPGRDTTHPDLRAGAPDPVGEPEEPDDALLDFRPGADALTSDAAIGDRLDEIDDEPLRETRSDPDPEGAFDVAEPAPGASGGPPPADGATALSGPDLTPMLRERLHDVLEKVAWEAFADLSEQVTRQALARVESIAWEVIPQMAESLVREEIRRMKGEDESE